MAIAAGDEQRAAASHTRQRELLARAARLIPGGTFDDLVLPESVAFVPRDAVGSRLHDVDGCEYIDYTLGGGSHILGHAHPDVVAAVRDQAGRGSSFSMPSEPLLDLADMLVEAVPCAEQVLFANTGTEATYIALRLASAATGRTRVLKFAGGYHGFHDVGIVNTASASEGPTPVGRHGISPRLVDEVLVAPFNDVVRTAALIDAHHETLSAVIVEPVQRVIAPRAEFLTMLREETRRHGIVLIFDEVVTGFRFHYGGAQAFYGVVPDIATYAKVIGGGYPLSAVAGNRDLMALLNPRGGKAAVSGSQHGNATAAAAGLAVLRHLRQPESFPRLRHLAAQMERTLRRSLDAAGVGGRVVVLGPVWHVLPFQAGDGPFYDHPSSLPADPERARKGIEALASGVIRRGVLVFPRRGRGYLRGYLSLAHTEEEIEKTGEAIAQALQECAQFLT